MQTARDQRAAVGGRTQREALVGHSVVLFTRLDHAWARLRMLESLHERAEPSDHGGERRDGLELGDDQRERAEQQREGHRRLGDDAELHLAADEQRRDDQHRDDLDQVVVAGGEEAEVAVHGDDAPEVADQRVDPAEQPAAESGSSRAANATDSAFSRTWIRSARKLASWSSWL